LEGLASAFDASGCRPDAWHVVASPHAGDRGEMHHRLGDTARRLAVDGAHIEVRVLDASRRRPSFDTTASNTG